MGFVIFEDASSIDNIPKEGVKYLGMILEWYSYEMKVAKMTENAKIQEELALAMTS
jgi:hypothetical protein